MYSKELWASVTVVISKEMSLVLYEWIPNSLTAVTQEHTSHLQHTVSSITRSLPKETRKAKWQKTKQRTLNKALHQVESENSDKKEEAECATIKCIISTLENVYSYRMGFKWIISK